MINKLIILGDTYCQKMQIQISISVNHSAIINDMNVSVIAKMQMDGLMNAHWQYAVAAFEAWCPLNIPLPCVFKVLPKVFALVLVGFLVFS